MDYFNLSSKEAFSLVLEGVWVVGENFASGVCLGLNGSNHKLRNTEFDGDDFVILIFNSKSCLEPKVETFVLNKQNLNQKYRSIFHYHEAFY